MFTYTKDELWVVPLMYCLIIAICLAIGFLLRNKKSEIRRIPIIIISSILLVLEIIKQTLLIINHQWTVWAIPLHFCSALMVWFAIASYSRKENTRQVGYATSFIGSLLLFILFAFYPSSIIGNACANIFANFSTFHTFTYHALSMMIWILIIVLRLYKPTKKNVFFAVLSLLIYFIVATIFAYSLNVNFVNILQSNIGFMEKLRIDCGQVIYTIVMYAFGIGASFAILCIYKLFYNLIQRNNEIQ